MKEEASINIIKKKVLGILKLPLSELNKEVIDAILESIKKQDKKDLKHETVK